MRQVAIDTETTGLEWKRGHRIVEIGAVEIVNRRITGRVFHTYLNPEHEIDPGAVAVHGLTLDFLRDKPHFADVAEEFLDFIRGAEVLAHNAAFDTEFLDAELRRLKRPGIKEVCTVVDTLKLSKEAHPGRKHALDDLCSRYGVDKSKRELHGALLDARLLAEVYLAMTRQQATLDIGDSVVAAENKPLSFIPGPLRVILPTAEELAAHERIMARLRAAVAG